MLQCDIGRVYDVVQLWQIRATRRSRQLHARYQKKTHAERRPARRARWILGNMSVKWGIGIWARRVKKFKYRQGKTQEKKHAKSCSGQASGQDSHLGEERQRGDCSARRIKARRTKRRNTMLGTGFYGVVCYTEGTRSQSEQKGYNKELPGSQS